MCPFSLQQPSTICPFSHLGCHLQKTSQNIPFQLGLPPVDTGVPNCLLMLRNDFNDFAFEHRSGCCATEPGYAGDIDAIEIWFIDWLSWKLSEGNIEISFISSIWLFTEVNFSHSICISISLKELLILMTKHLNLYPGNCACFTAASPPVHAPDDARSGYHDTKPGATCTSTEFNDGKLTTTQVFLFAFHLLFPPLPKQCRVSVLKSYVSCVCQFLLYLFSF